MTDLDARLRIALGGDWELTRSPWEGLMRLYEADREAFYLLACDVDLGGISSPFRPLAEFAQQVRTAVRGAYRLVPPSETAGAAVQTSFGRTLPVPQKLFPSVRQFLLDIDGKGMSAAKGRDFEGRAVSEAEARFKLGEPGARIQDELGRQARREASPLVFRVSAEDLHSLQTLPAFVTHDLLMCVRKTILAPTATYRGLKRGEKAPRRLSDGWAICGKPGRAYDNAGRPVPAPADMVYMVYADTHGYVFDWDWVQEDPHAPGHPLDEALRFGNLLHETREMVLDLPDRIDPGQFDPTKPAPSPRGDCIFCYMADAPSYGARINEDLTVFYSRAERQSITGFKIKNVQRILNEEQFLHLKDAPGLNVLILPILRKILQDQPDVTIKLYELIIGALVNVKISFSEPPADDVETIPATCEAHAD